MVPPTGLTISALAPSGIALRAAGGGTSLIHSIQATTNVTPPLRNWMLIGHLVADRSKVIQFFDPHTRNGQRFYRIGQ